ncbi:uncharacterized protein LOC125056588 isoform X1 [Pieris napi]|uniref:uncharacterized protein LOC125056588 isoform X1 n=1 Tax=Pieris napi TaxID=78633 RepID=UPI001FB8F94E|nr:uncharacterized protein LOC125056588 isoform X1 [Pieris napi]
MTRNCDYELSWESCPVDIMLIIFKTLSIKDINSCFQVNKTWRNVVTYYCDRYNLWQKLVQETIFNRGITVMDHTYSSGGNKEIYLNSILWHDLSLAKCGISYVDAVNARQIHVDSDCLTVVFHDKVIVYNVNNLIPLEKIPKNYEDFQCKGDLIVNVVRQSLGKYMLSINNNCNCKNKDVSFHIPSPHLWSMNKTSCYFLDTDYTIWKYIFGDCDNHCHFIAKYYGNRSSVQGLFMENDTVLMALNNGKIYLYLEVDGQVLQKYFWGQIDFQLHWLDTSIAIYGCPSNVQLSETCNSLIFPNISTATRHGNIILLGYNDGLLEVYDSSKIYFKKPLQQFLLRFNDTQMPIRKIVVHEGYRTHTIFALVGNKISKIHLTHEAEFYFF